MEFCPQNLSDYVEYNKGEAFDFCKCYDFSKQLVTAVAYLHQNNVIHRDLKPWNILISKCGKKIKVADMGLSRTVSDENTETDVTRLLAGTKGFRAPEIYDLTNVDEDGAGKYAYKSDIFPLGLNIYFIFTNGKHPFGDDCRFWDTNIIKGDRPDLSEIPIIPEPHTGKLDQLITLLETMLNENYKKRPTAQEVLENNFFQGLLYFCSVFILVFFLI